jgi:single-stranded-DNA-specific exonuclease
LLKANAESDLSRDRAIVLAEYGWHPGVIGIVASRIKDEFHRPTVIIAIDNDGIGKGSARSITGFDLYDALTEGSDHLMNYGGHPMAAGLTLSEGKFEDFKKAFLSFAESNLSEEDMEPRLKLDAEIQLNDINSRFMRFLELLGPYGPGNMRPKFVARNLKVVGNPRIIGNGNHIRFRVKQERTSFPTIGFNLSEHYEDLIKGNSVDLAFVVEVNEWRGKSTIQLNLRDIKQANIT